MVVVTENTRMPKIRDYSFGYILYIAEKDMTATHAALSPRIGKVCPLKAPQKPGEITFFPLFLPSSTPTRIHTHNILLYTGCSTAIVQYIRRTGPGMKIIIYETQRSKH
jgi:hypothetical protein